MEYCGTTVYIIDTYDSVCNLYTEKFAIIFANIVKKFYKTVGESSTCQLLGRHSLANIVAACENVPLYILQARN